jgi:hypothetical protein
MAVSPRLPSGVRGHDPGFQEFAPKQAFARYCWLTTDSLVKRDHGPQARGAASFHATPRTLCDVLVAFQGRLGP